MTFFAASLINILVFVFKKRQSSMIQGFFYYEQQFSLIGITNA
jgi:hypothetical protein